MTSLDPLESSTQTELPSPHSARRLAISLQIKVVALVLLAAALVFGGMLWKTESLLVQDKIAFINDSAMKQMAPLKRLVQQRMNIEKEELIEFAGIRVGQNAPGAQSLQFTRAMNASFGNFDVISLMQVGETGQWSPSWIERSPNAKEDRWPKGHDLTLLKSLSYARVRDGETVWARVSDRQGAPVYAFMISVEIQNAANEKEDVSSSTHALPDTAEQALASMNSAAKAVLVGFTGVNPLAAVTEDFIGSTNSVYLVDDRGYVASHVNKAYLGALFSEDPLVRDIIRGKKAGSTGRFEDLESRPVLGHYEKVEHSNLYAVITTPEQILSAMVGKQRQAAILWGAAILLAVLGLASLISWVIARNASRPVVVSAEPTLAAAPTSVAAQEKAEERTEVPAAPEPAPIVIERVRERTEKEKMLTDGLMQALTEPLHGILGHASLVRVKANEDDIQDHADSISREARRMRDVVERIHDWQDETEATKKSAESTEEKVDLNAAVTAALKERDADLVTEDIHVIRELRPLPLLAGSQERLENAIGRIIENAIEAMHARSAKHLRVETHFKDEKVSLRITDTGIGMSRDVRDRAFDPFFKGFESPERLGLGLSSVASVVKALGGTQAIESVMGEGSTFTFTFPVTKAEREAFNTKDLQSIAASVSQTRAPAIEQPVEEPVVEPADELVAEEPPGLIAEPQLPLASFSDNDDDEDDLKIEVIQPALFSPKVKEEMPRDEIVEEPRSATTGPLMLDELDDDDEMFANISLSKAASRLTKVGQIAPLKTELKAEPKAFEVKIRKPKLAGSSQKNEPKPPTDLGAE